MRIAVLGAGAWGTALAAAGAPRHDTLLWGRDPAQVARMRTVQCNERYLPDLELPGELGLTDVLPEAMAHGEAGLIVIGTPMSGLQGLLEALPRHARVLWLCKGFQAGTGRLGHEVARAVCPEAACGVLSGPSFAQEVARNRPTALVCASTDAALREATVEAFHAGALRIYTSDDPVGVEVGGAVKNVLAIATGVCDGLALGQNARAALITRGLAEMTRLGLALGARAETFMGLSGLGDLVLTATGDLSRNRKVGLLLAEGQPLERILRELGHVAEGVPTARTVLQRARELGIDMPITAAVNELLDGRASAPDLVRALMARDVRNESA